MIKKQDLLKQPEIQLIINALKREQWTRLFVGFSAIGFGIWILSIFQVERKSWIIGAISLGLIVVGIQLIYNVLQSWKVQTMPLMKLLLHEPKEIVWVYSIVTTRMPFGLLFSQMETMYFKLMDGDEITIRLAEEHISEVSAFLNDVLPHASFGYTREREQWFLANPAMLIAENYSDSDNY